MSHLELQTRFKSILVHIKLENRQSCNDAGPRKKLHSWYWQWTTQLWFNHCNWWSWTQWSSCKPLEEYKILHETCWNEERRKKTTAHVTRYIRDSLSIRWDWNQSTENRINYRFINILVIDNAKLQWIWWSLWMILELWIREDRKSRSTLNWKVENSAGCAGYRQLKITVVVVIKKSFGVTMPSPASVHIKLENRQ